ncbi:MAG: phosphofructokinase [Anaerolineales bacterium]|nr:phosphofructokinase [Anaerolineales bacterium]
MRIGILTGGGDVPGLNPCIRTLVNRALDEGHEPVGIRRGWQGLLHYNPDDPTTHDACMMRLDRTTVRTIHRTGGTILHTSRTNPAKVRPSDAPSFLPVSAEQAAAATVDYTPHVLKVLAHLGIDVLVPIGGDDTLGYGVRLHREGFPVVCIPKTMDNDVNGTDFCIGFSTTVTLSVKLINQMRSAVGSHERIGVVELFGRRSGATSFYAAYLAGADRAIISEVPFDPVRLSELLLKDRAANPSNYAIVTVSEGATEIEGQIVESGEADAFGHRKLGGIGQLLSEQIKRITGVNTMYQQLGYLMRSGAPDALDVMVASNYAHMAMDLVNRGEFGYMVALRKGCYTYVPADWAGKPARQVDVEAMYDVEEYRPKIRHIQDTPMFLY